MTKKTAGKISANKARAKYFSEVVTYSNFEGEMLKSEELVGKEIILLDYEIMESKNEKYKNKTFAYVSIEIDEEKKQFSTGSIGLLEQLTRVRENDGFPCIATIEERKNEKGNRSYYSFV